MCHLKPTNTAPCFGPSSPRFYYDPSTKKCETFNFTECGGQDNFFQNYFKKLEDCLRLCEAYYPQFA